MRGHLADRDRGVKVSEAARLLGFSQPTIRAWIEAGILDRSAESKPARVDVLSLVTAKRAVDLLVSTGTTATS